MPGLGFPVLGTWAVNKVLGTTTVAYVRGIPPFMGKSPILQTAANRGRGITHIKKICVTAPTSGAAVSVWTILQPLNYAVITAGILKNTVPTLALADDPGVYSTNYKYQNGASGVVACVANNAIAAGDYVAFQLADGTWRYDIVASGTYAALVLTATLPNSTGAGGITAGSLLYHFGVATDVNPATGVVGPQSDLPGIAALVTRDTTWSDEFGIAAAVHDGDPLIIYSDGASSASTLEFASGYYADF